MSLSIYHTHTHSLGHMSEREKLLGLERETTIVERSYLCFRVLILVLIISLRKLWGFLLYGFPEEIFLCLLSLLLCLCFIVVHVILSVKDPKIIMLA